MEICYSFRLCIWAPPVYLSLSDTYILASIFPSYYYVLLVCVLLQNVGFHRTPVCVYLSISLLIVHICYIPFLCIRFSFQRGHSFFSTGASSLEVNMLLYIFSSSFTHSIWFSGVSLFVKLVSSSLLFKHLCSLFLNIAVISFSSFIFSLFCFEWWRLSCSSRHCLFYIYSAHHKFLCFCILAG